MKQTRLVISGSIAVDRIMNFSGHYRELIEPSKIEILSVSVLVESLDEAEGGTGANIACGLACLGDSPVLIGSIGSNAPSYLDRLGSIGIDTSSVHVSKLPTASFNVLTDSAENQVGGFYPGAMSDAESLTFVPWKDESILACISAHDPIAMRRQTDECAQHSIRLVYDPGQQVSNITGDDLRAGVEAAEVVLVNEYEVNLLQKKTGWSNAELQSRIPVLITTHGEHGSIVSGSRFKKPIKIGSVKPDRIIDPTGAGDAYRAGFLYGYLSDWDVRECCQLGSVMASFALELHGPQVQVSREIINQRYKTTYNKELEL